MEKKLTLQKYTDQFHRRYDLSRVFERPSATEAKRSTLYVDSDSGRWFEDNQPLKAPNPLLSFLWKELNPQVSEDEYQTVLKEYDVPSEGTPEAYQTLFVAHVAGKLAIAVGQTNEEVRIFSSYQAKPPEETDCELASHHQFAQRLGNEADIFAGDFDYFRWRGPFGTQPDGTWESTIRVRRESV